MAAKPHKPTMEDVAGAAGVSRALVSLVFRGSTSVSGERRHRVLAAAETLGYRPNALARGLASRRTRTIGVLINDLHNPFFADIYDGLEDVADELGLRLLLTTARRRDGGESAAIDTMVDHRVEAHVLVSPRLADAVIVGASAHVPLVVIGRRVDGPAIDSVMADESDGALKVVGHLAGLGHRSVTHIDGGHGAGAAERRNGYAAAMHTLGLGPVDVIAGDFTESSGEQAAMSLLERGALPTAVFAANDLVAIGVMHAFAQTGVRVPEHVSVVGYDNTALAHLHHLSLTTINQPRREMGEAALRLLDERLTGTRDAPVVHLAPPTLVERRTTAPPRWS